MTAKQPTFFKQSQFPQATVTSKPRAQASSGTQHVVSQCSNDAVNEDDISYEDTIT
jgi:hypothetical protein